MGVVQLSDELQRVVDQHVAEGFAPSPEALVEEALLRLLRGELYPDDELQTAIENGLADIAAGRYVTVETAGDAERLSQDILSEVQARLNQEQ